MVKVCSSSRVPKISLTCSLAIAVAAQWSAPQSSAHQEELRIAAARVIGQGRAQGQLPRATIINAAGNPTRPHDPRPPRLAVVSDLPGDSETKPT